MLFNSNLMIQHNIIRREEKWDRMKWNKIRRRH